MEKDRGDNDPAAPLLSGLLLVGRLSWLLKIRGRFFEEALSPAPLFTQSSSSSSSSSSSDSSSGKSDSSSNEGEKAVCEGMQYYLLSPPSPIFFLITFHRSLSLPSPSLSYVQMHFMHFINTARYVAQLTPVTLYYTAAYNHDQVSEDQMRSAFEIADTNGDGVLTYTEAVEVKSLTFPSLHCFSACMHTCYNAYQEYSILFSLPW